MKLYPPLQTHQSFKFLQLCGFLYLSALLACSILTYKIIDIYGVTLSTATFVVPLWYSLGDLITEVYGYKNARNLMWFSLIAQAFFIAICSSIILIPSHDVSMQRGFELVLLHLPRVYIASFVAAFVGMIFNIYLISKWKVLVKGKWFFWRSITSTIAGTSISTALGVSIAFSFNSSHHEIMQLIWHTIIFKIFTDPIFAGFSSFAAYHLKKIEGIDWYDTNISYSPFRLD